MIGVYGVKDSVDYFTSFGFVIKVKPIASEKKSKRKIRDINRQTSLPSGASGEPGKDTVLRASVNSARQPEASSKALFKSEKYPETSTASLFHSARKPEASSKSLHKGVYA